MRRLFWVGLGVAAGAAGPRWIARRAGGQAGPDAGPGPAPAKLVELAGSAGTVAARGAARLAAGGARRVHARVERAVDGGRADARDREAQLRRALAARPRVASPAAGFRAAGAARPRTPAPGGGRRSGR